MNRPEEIRAEALQAAVRLHARLKDRTVDKTTRDAVLYSAGVFEEWLRKGSKP